MFDDFLDANDLRELAITSNDDDEIVSPFPRRRSFPNDMRRASLWAFLDLCYYPLAVRSSSSPGGLAVPAFRRDLRDPHGAQQQPRPRGAARGAVARHQAHLRLDLLGPWPSATWCSTSYRLEEEKMGVILQRIVGAEHEERFYPEMAGVALSQNYYPVEPIKAEDGLVAVALGLGPAVVEGEDCLRFSPRHPERLVQMSSVSDALDNSQRQFYALNLDSEGDAVSAEAHGEEAQLGRYDLAVCRKRRDACTGGLDVLFRK